MTSVFCKPAPSMSPRHGSPLVAKLRQHNEIEQQADASHEKQDGDDLPIARIMKPCRDRIHSLSLLLRMRLPGTNHLTAALRQGPAALCSGGATADHVACSVSRLL